MPCAWHMARCDLKSNTCPPGVTGGFWGVDSKEQWLEALVEHQAGTDYWSIHLYANNTSVDNGCYFKSFANESCAPLTDVIAAASTAASIAGRGLYLGEYGGPHPNFTGPTKESQAFPSAALALQHDVSTEKRRCNGLSVRCLGGLPVGAWRLPPSHWVVGAPEPPPVAPGSARNTRSHDSP